ncbi:MAG: hypothetical protein JNM75_10175 [Rhodospirillales bacterium]|nr:hypothetical protein [Rhodospirillales bacterium]
MAMALITAASREPGREAELAQSLRRTAPHAQPNRLMIQLGDALLGCEGRLVDAVKAMGPAAPTEFAPLVGLAPLRGAEAHGRDARSPLAGAGEFCGS